MTENLNEVTQTALSRGFTDGADLLMWMHERKMDSGNAIAAIAWCMAALIHSATDETMEQRMVCGFRATVDLYLNFLSDTEKAHQTEIRH